MTISSTQPFDGSPEHPRTERAPEASRDVEVRTARRLDSDTRRLLDVNSEFMQSLLQDKERRAKYSREYIKSHWRPQDSLKNPLDDFAETLFSKFGIHGDLENDGQLLIAIVTLQMAGLDFSADYLPEQKKRVDGMYGPVTDAAFRARLAVMQHHTPPSNEPVAGGREQETVEEAEAAANETPAAPLVQYFENDPVFQAILQNPQELTRRARESRAYIVRELGPAKFLETLRALGILRNEVDLRRDADVLAAVMFIQKSIGLEADEIDGIYGRLTHLASQEAYSGNLTNALEIARRRLREESGNV